MMLFASYVSDVVARRAWWSLSALMALRCLFGDLGATKNRFVVENTASVLMCSGAAFFLLVDCYQQSKFWPRFDVPELGRFPTTRRSRTPLPTASSGWKSFRLLSCLLAVAANFQLALGLKTCLGDRPFFDCFFISELGTGPHAETFTNTLLCFGLFMLPFFLSFVLEHHHRLPPECFRFAAGGTMTVCGIIGIGIWNLHSPLHYVSIAIWLWPLSVILDQHVPTPRGFVDVRLPTWIVKSCMAAYVISMIVLGFSDTGHTLCVIAQRLVVVTTLVWLLLVLKIVTAECLGFGELVNGSADDSELR